MTSWTPILTGDEAARAQAIAVEIADSVAASSHVSAEEDPLRALLDAYLAKALVSERHLDRAFDRLEAQFAQRPPHAGFGLFRGISGLAWAATHIRALLAEWLEPADDPCDEIDEIILQLVKSAPERTSYDLISGLAGLAVYARERLPSSAAVEIWSHLVQRLAERAERSEDGVRWWTAPELLPDHQRKAAPNGYYNLGVAHGIPALSVVFARAVERGIASDLAWPLLEESVSWFGRQQLPQGTGARFPAYVPRPPGMAGSPTRQGWCYGGLGLSAALLAAARAVGRDEWEPQAIEYARLEAGREAEETGVVDMCLCHGGAGNGHVYNRLYQATGEVIFRDAATRWLRSALSSYDRTLGPCGFLFRRGIDGVWGPNFDFLNGSAGVALALLAASSDVTPEWDRVLMTDISPLLAAGGGSE